ncbi:MAG: CPBP family intramembrane metalloprotease, partial [Leptospiraceae bacterium]|nr:CPBP family intramembrane metalloprotease [Leptospiraceae bacterium]
AIVAPVCTELFFRGLLLGLGMETANLSRQRSAVMWYAIIFQTILYAFSNLNPWEIVTGIPLGLIFGYLRVRMASILVPTVLHAAFSAIKISNIYFWPDAPFLLNRPDGIESLPLLISIPAALIIIATIVRTEQLAHRTSSNTAAAASGAAD